MIIEPDPVGGGQPHLEATAAEDMGHQAGGGGFAVGPRYGHYRDPAGPPGGKEVIHYLPRHIPALPLRRVKVHPEARGRIDLDDGAPCLLQRGGNVGRDQVHPRHIQAHRPGRPQGHQGIGGMKLVGDIDGRAPGA